MAFQIKKISDVGTNHPIVARLGVQTMELLQWSGLDKAQKEAVAELYVKTLTQRLVRCDQANSAIKKKLDEDIARIKKNVENDPRSLEIPYVVGLEGNVEDFLYEAKNYLRDLLGIFRVALECTLTDASAFADMKGKGDGDLIKWAIATFGKSDELVRELRSDQVWITELIRRRNAIEHPGQNSGTLTIHNVGVHSSQQGIVPPSWERTGIPESDVMNDMTTYVDNLLSLAEDVLANLVMRTGPFKVAQIYEIPNDKRDPACPVRLRVHLNVEMLGKLNDTAAKSSAGAVGEIANVETSQEEN